MLALRQLVFEVADQTPEAGKIVEVLRWGQPSYITPDTKSGTTIRIAEVEAGGFGLFAHCQTTVISDYATHFPGQDRIDGNRGILFAGKDQIDPARHGLLIRSALTYHLKKEN